MKYDWWKSGQWNAICDVCGFKRKSNELTARWDGLMVCTESISPGCWERRHPQELIRPIPDQNKLPWTRPETEDQFIQTNFTNTASCTPMGMLGQADYGTADCAIVGNVSGGLIS